MNLRPTASDGIVLLYNYAVVLSGGWVAMRLGIQDNVQLLTFALLLVVGWTVYFRIGMAPRLSRLADGEDAEESTSS
jgi:hypothetical protein